MTALVNDLHLFALTLDVPDAMVARLRDSSPLARLVREGVPELDFLHPGWWEQARTVRLGLARTVQWDETGRRREGAPGPTGQTTRGELGDGGLGGPA